MKLEKRFLLIALISIALAVPLSMALQHRTKLLNLEKLQNNQLQIQIKTEQKKNEELQKQVELKRAAEAEVVIAQVQSAPVAVSGGCEAFRGIVAQYSWNVTTALAVCNAESSGNPNSHNPTDGHTTCQGSRGLFQIGCDSTHNYAGMFDPVANVAQAFALYQSRGWSPWGSTTCAVKVQCI